MLSNMVVFICYYLHSLQLLYKWIAHESSVNDFYFFEAAHWGVGIKKKSYREFLKEKYSL